jgi:hypothetical protein
MVTSALTRETEHQQGSQEDPLWLVIDDVHELRSAQALAQLELLVMRAGAPSRPR